MHSLFSRSRKDSGPRTATKLATASILSQQDCDEFGRPLPSKRILRSPDIDTPQDGAFLPFAYSRSPSPVSDSDSDSSSYGFLSLHPNLVLGLPELNRIVAATSSELAARGLTTPFLFSPAAAALVEGAGVQPGVRRIVRAFLATCPPHDHAPSSDPDRAWHQEIRLATPHDLSIVLRWALARPLRFASQRPTRGLVPWDTYLQWRDDERGHTQLPPTHFAAFLAPLQHPLPSLLTALFTLLARLTAHSDQSGHTPPSLSPLFGPLLFGLGDPGAGFHHTYATYLRTADAAEHLLLAFIRWWDTPHAPAPPARFHGSAASALGVPKRLKDWIRGYPAHLPALHPAPLADPRALQPRKGARTVRVACVRRNVRAYSRDLVRTAAAWAAQPRTAAPVSSSSSSPTAPLAASKEWQRVAPPALRLPPRYTEAYRRRMDMPPHAHPVTDPAAGRPDGGRSPRAGAPALAPSPSSSAASSSSADGDAPWLGLGLAPGADDAAEKDRFRSLTDMQWGEFELRGFGGVRAERKLQFDLTESAREARAARRTTLTWSDFSTAGFSRSDAPLNATLQFSPPITATISAWPAHSAELARKLRRPKRAGPRDRRAAGAFAWDTEPVLAPDEVVEEAFLDVFCDLLYGGGWMERGALDDPARECSWALVEFKSLPLHCRPERAAGDPRTASALFLFEEVVPREHRARLAATARAAPRRPRLPALFSPAPPSPQQGQGTPRRPAAAPIGRPPTPREVEFEGLLRDRQGATKILSLAPPEQRAAHPPPPPAPPKPALISAPLYVAARADSPRRLSSRFRLPVPGGGGSGGGSAPHSPARVPAEYAAVDFETRLAGDSDDDADAGGAGAHAARGPARRERRRRSRDDAWVDILVATHSRRLAAQDAHAPPGARKGAHSDPELASQEVAQALAGVRARSPPSDYGADEDVGRAPAGGWAEGGRGAPGADVPEEVASSLADTSVYDDDEDDADADAEPDPPTDTEARARARRRLGYFDLHPERRAPASPARAPPAPLDSTAYLDEELAERELRTPVPAPPYRDASPPAAAAAPAARARLARLDVPVAAVSSPDASPVDPAPPAGTLTPPRSAGKTAALIEMYRRKDAEAAAPPPPPASPQPSRLPVRTPLLGPQREAPSPAAAAGAPATTPSPPSASTHSHSPGPAAAVGAAAGYDDDDDDDTARAAYAGASFLDAAFMDPPRIAADEAGRASPGRYVHGAPLHNVLEEEEEEV